MEFTAEDRARKIILHQDLRKALIEAEDDYKRKKALKGELVDRTLMCWAVNGRKAIKIIMSEINELMTKEIHYLIKQKTNR